MTTFANPESATLLEDLVRSARRAGADAADAMLIEASGTSVTWRMGKIETLEREETGDFGLRVFIGKQQALVSGSDRRPEALKELVERAVAMARLAPEDPFCGLADPEAIAKTWPQIELADDADPSVEAIVALTRTAEEAALAVPGVTNSQGAGASAHRLLATFVASNGFAGQYSRTSRSIGATVLAGRDMQMERDYEHASAVMFADLPDAAGIGKKAAQRTVKKLGSRKMPTGRLPVVFEPRVAGGLIGQLSGSIAGPGIARGTSFLKDKMGQALFQPNITIVDDPFRARGLRSKPFDAEGLLPQKRKIIDKGVLTTWLLDSRSARQLKLASTGHATRATGGQPSPSASNLYMEPGTLTPADLIRDIKQGFYVTQLMGMGVNGVTGDYSQAASGFWIENGEIAFPVSEMTIAGNLKDMYMNLTPANDLVFERGVDAPTLRVEGMTIAGV